MTSHNELNFTSNLDRAFSSIFTVTNVPYTNGPGGAGANITKARLLCKVATASIPLSIYSVVLISDRMYIQLLLENMLFY